MPAFPETLPEGGSAAAPTVQGGSARESRPGTPNGSAFKPPRRNRPPGQPGPDGDHPAGAASAGLNCPDRAPVRPYVLHALPYRYGEGHGRHSVLVRLDCPVSGASGCFCQFPCCRGPLSPSHLFNNTLLAPPGPQGFWRRSCSSNSRTRASAARRASRSSSNVTMGRPVAGS